MSSRLCREYLWWKRRLVDFVNLPIRVRVAMRLMEKDNDIDVVVPGSTKFIHNGVGVVINRNVVLGRFVVIGPNVTLGGYRKKSPVIGDRVRIGAGAVVTGDVVVGHDSVVAPGAVVYRDVPPFSVVKGDCVISKAVKRV